MLRLINDTVCFGALAMLQTFDDPDSIVIDPDCVFTTAIITHKFYSSFLLELQPAFDKELEENTYRKYVRSQLNCFVAILSYTEQTTLFEKSKEQLIDGSSNDILESFIVTFMKQVSKKQRSGQIQHIPPNKGNYLSPAQIVFAEVMRELITSLGFGFFDDSIRNYLIDYMVTCQFELPRSQLLFILALSICICLTFKEEKNKNKNMLELIYNKKDFLTIEFSDFKESFDKCIKPDT